ncbi:unnamed protein product, partial [Brachionus calyciflorus]
MKNENLERKLNELDIEKSQCSTFIPSKVSNKCECGLDQINHDRYALEKQNKPSKWDRETCTKPGGITDAYGNIFFKDKNEEISKYIRVYYKTPMNKMIKLLFDDNYWQLKYPRLLISVTGGANLSISRLLMDILCKGLVKAASTT